jgi:hypothetical protein
VQVCQTTLDQAQAVLQGSQLSLYTGKAGMEIAKKPRLLICGDSYMAFDPRAEHYNKEHWATHLLPYVDIDNQAFPGASNTQIFMQLQQALKKYQPNYIVLGFTHCYRLEFGEQRSTCHPDINPSEEKLYQLYIKHIDPDLEEWRNLAIARLCVMLAQQTAPTRYSLNLISHAVNRQNDLFFKNNQAKLNIKLSGHEQSSPDDADFRTYHVRNFDILADYAQEIKSTLLGLK